MQVVGREALAVLLKLPTGRPDWAHKRLHVRLLRGAPALLHVARRARGEDVLPRGLAAQPPGRDVVERQMLRAAAVLAREAVAQKHVEARERGKLAGPHELPQR